MNHVKILPKTNPVELSLLEENMGLTMKERNSVTKEIADRYRKSGKKEKKSILDEYIRLTGFHRK